MLAWCFVMVFVPAGEILLWHPWMLRRRTARRPRNGLHEWVTGLETSAKHKSARISFTLRARIATRSGTAHRKPGNHWNRVARSRRPSTMNSKHGITTRNGTRTATQNNAPSRKPETRQSAHIKTRHEQHHDPQRDNRRAPEGANQPHPHSTQQHQPQHTAPGRHSPAEGPFRLRRGARVAPFACALPRPARLRLGGPALSRSRFPGRRHGRGRAGRTLASNVLA